MANASLQPIYERLNGVNNYHPYSANTFADWSVEAGDIVTVKRGNESYASPAHSVSMNWKGQSKVVLESKGEKTRGSVAVMSAKSYTSGGGGGNSYRSSRSGGRRTQEELAGVLEYAQSVEIYAKEADNSLSSRITVSAGKIEQVVNAVGDNGEVTAASITLAINHDTGSNIRLSADKIDIDGLVQKLAARAIGVGSLEVEGRAEFKNTVYAEAAITAEEAIRSNTGFNVGGVSLGVADVTVSGNTLTITYADGRPSQTFSKATSASGAWSGGIYTVTARQGSTVMDTDTTTLFSGEVSGYTQWAGNTAFISIKAFTKSTSTLQDTGRTVSLNCQDIYDAGKRDGSGSYSLFGYFDKYGTVTVEGQTYTAYITQSTSASASHLALYRK